MGRGDHSRVIVGNLDYRVTEAQLREKLSEFAEIIDLRIPRNPATSRSKGLAIVDLPNAEVADHLHKKLNAQLLFGRTCYIRFDDQQSEIGRGPRRDREKEHRYRSDYDSDSDDRPSDRYTHGRDRHREHERDRDRKRERTHDRDRDRQRDRDRHRRRDRERESRSGNSDSPTNRRSDRRSDRSSDDD